MLVERTGSSGLPGRDGPKAYPRPTAPIFSELLILDSALWLLHRALFRLRVETSLDTAIPVGRVPFRQTPTEDHRHAYYTCPSFRFR